MKILLSLSRGFFFVVAFSFACEASGGAVEDVNSRFIKQCDREWFQCQSDKDCGVTKGICTSRVAANKGHLDKVMECLGKQVAPYLCADFASAHWPDHANCVTGECALVWKKQKIENRVGDKAKLHKK